jgi:putative ABC transport system permease protein
MLSSSFYVFEHSYDRFYSEDEPISRVLLEFTNRTSDYLPYFMGEDLKESSAELEDLTRVKFNSLQSVISLNRDPNKLFDESNIAFADTNFFDFFNRRLVLGSKERFKSVVNAVVLTESTAKRYFGDQNPLGEVIVFTKEDLLLEVVGVVEDYPSNSSIQLNLICSMNSLKSNPKMATYFDQAYQGFLYYVKTGKEAQTQAIAKKLNSYVKGKKMMGQSEVELKLESISDIHMKSENLSAIYSEQGDPQFATWLLLISIVVLGLGIFNYSNLSLALAFKQVKGVGIRKVMGANRETVLVQFITDSLLTGFIVLISAGFLYEFCLPYFEKFVDRSFNDMQGLRPLLYGLSLVVCLVSGFMAGLYRAFILSRVQPIKLVKGHNAIPAFSKVRATLLWFQFSVAFVLITTAIYMTSQMGFILNKDLGATVENRLVIKNVNQNTEILKSELAKIKGVEALAFSTFYPGIKKLSGGKKNVDFIPGVENSEIMLLGLDEDFFELYNVKVLDNGGLSEEVLFNEKSDFVLINEAALKLFQGHEHIGVTFKPLFKGQNNLTIKGVVSDFNVASLHHEIQPMIFTSVAKSKSSRFLNISYEPSEDPNELLSRIEQVYRKFLPNQSFEALLLEDEIAALYKEETKMKTLVSVLTLISILIIISGILGLVVSDFQLKLKEIGIRKVLGAGYWQLQVIQNKKLIYLLVLTLVVGIPMSIQAINFWKTDFIYRISISPAMFIMSSLVIVVSSLIISIALTSRASSINPVQVLRND